MTDLPSDRQPPPLPPKKKETRTQYQIFDLETIIIMTSYLEFSQKISQTKKKKTYCVWSLVVLCDDASVAQLGSPKRCQTAPFFFFFSRPVSPELEHQTSITGILCVALDHLVVPFSFSPSDMDITSCTVFELEAPKEPGKTKKKEKKPRRESLCYTSGSLRGFFFVVVIARTALLLLLSDISS